MHGAAARLSFLQSQTLWEQMHYLERKGTMHLVRDYNLIFHGCVPVDEAGRVPADARRRRGIPRPGALRGARTPPCTARSATSDQRDLDLLWYLWCGPLSPLFGKDKIATFESYFIADKATHTGNEEPVLQAHPREGILPEHPARISAWTTNTG